MNEVTLTLTDDELHLIIGTLIRRFDALGNTPERARICSLLINQLTTPARTVTA